MGKIKPKKNEKRKMILIIDEETGEVEIEMKNFEGKDCEKDTAWFTRGFVTKKERKKDCYDDGKAREKAKEEA